MNAQIEKNHLFKYALYKFYKLAKYLTTNHDKQLLDVAKYYIESTHEKITHLKIFKNIDLSTQHMHNIQLCNSYMINVDIITLKY